MRNVLLVLAVLVGFSVPLQAQTALPVQVLCIKRTLGGTYKPTCKHLKQAVKRNPLFKPAKKGNRYVVQFFAKTCETAGPGNRQSCNSGDAAMSVTFEAVISDPLSQRFPYHISSFPMVYSPSESALLAEVLIDVALPLVVAIFSGVVDEINSYGASGRQLDEATVEELQRTMELEMNRFLKEQTNRRDTAILPPNS